MKRSSIGSSNFSELSYSVRFSSSKHIRSARFTSDASLFPVLLSEKTELSYLFLVAVADSETSVAADSSKCCYLPESSVAMALNESSSDSENFLTNLDLAAFSREKVNGSVESVVTPSEYLFFMAIRMSQSI